MEERWKIWEILREIRELRKSPAGEEPVKDNYEELTSFLECPVSLDFCRNEVNQPLAYYACL